MDIKRYSEKTLDFILKKKILEVVKIFCEFTESVLLTQARAPRSRDLLF